MQTTFDVIELSKIIGALGVIFGFLFGAFKLYDRITDKQSEHDKTLGEVREENEKLRKTLSGEIKKINTENTLICYSIMACLDGLEQLGANHTVTNAKDMLSKHLNKAAHDEE